MTQRHATVTRKTKETEIEVQLTLDGTGQSKIESGIGFLDHLLTAFAKHARFDLELKCAAAHLYIFSRKSGRNEQI